MFLDPLKDSSFSGYLIKLKFFIQLLYMQYSKSYAAPSFDTFLVSLENPRRGGSCDGGQGSSLLTHFSRRLTIANNFTQSIYFINFSRCLIV